MLIQVEFTYIEVPIENFIIRMSLNVDVPLVLTITTHANIYWQIHIPPIKRL